MSGSGQCPSLKRKFIFVLSLEAIATLAFVRDGGWKYYAHRKDHLQVDQIDRLDPIWYAVMIFWAGSSSYKCDPGNMC